MTSEECFLFIRMELELEKVPLDEISDGRKFWELNWENIKLEENEFENTLNESGVRKSMKKIMKFELFLM